MVCDDGQLSTSCCPSYTSQEHCVYRPSGDPKLACERKDTASVMEQTLSSRKFVIGGRGITLRHSRDWLVRPSRRHSSANALKAGLYQVEGDVDHDISASMLPLQMPQWLTCG
jgi:hypothetical protein